MKVKSLALSQAVVTTICGVAIAIALGAPSARADQWDKRTVLQVNQPIQVRNTLLEPGTYVLRLLNSSVDRHIVQIFNGDQTRIIGTVLAVPRYRLKPADKSEFTFWETPSGNANALRAWFYPGDMIGQEFPYPTHPAVLSASLNIPASALMAPLDAEASPPPAPATQESETAPPQNQPTEMAETAAPATPEPAPQPEPAPEPQPAAQEPPPAAAPAPDTLPRTASPYPALGLAGFLAVGVFGLLRWRRTA